MINEVPEWVVDYLNSPIIKWYFPLIATDLGDKGVRYFKQFVELIPIPSYFSNQNMYEQFNLSEDEIRIIEGIKD
jgi:hypothetical protein